MEPTDKLVLQAQLSSVLEATTEYIEDPKQLLARNPQGKLLRMKLKLSISNKGPGSLLRNVKVHLSTLPVNVYSEEHTWKFAELDFRKSAVTPPVVQAQLYATKEGVPSGDGKVVVTATYTQVVGDQSVMRTQIAEVGLPLAFFVQINAANQSEVREQDVKLNLVLSRAVPSLPSLFEDAIESLQARETVSQL